MRILTLILMTCALSTGHFCSAQQEPIYKWGEPCTNDHIERRIDQLLSLGESGFVLLRKFVDNTYTSTYWIEEYSTSLKLIGTQKVNFAGGVMGDSYDIEDLQAINGKIYVFVTHWMKDYGHNSLSVKELALDGTMKDLADLEQINAEKLGNRGNYEISFSEDGSKLVVLAELPFEKKTNENLRVSCFEVSSMKKLWFTEKELDWPSERAYHNEITVNNNGGIVLFKKIWMKPTWQYAIYTANKGSDFSEYTELGLTENEIIDYKMLSNANDEIFIYATTSRESSGFEKRVHGSWFAKFDKDLAMKTSKQADWTSELLNQVLNDRAAAKHDAYLLNYNLKDVIFRQDGKLIVLLEQTKKTKDGIPGTQPVKYSYEWTYGGLLATCLNPDTGDILWSQAFEKTQSVKNNDNWDDYGSFVYFMKENRLSILWNNTPLSGASIPPANWTEPDGTKYVKHKAFGDKTMHATFLRVIEPDGSLAYADRKFGLPLLHLHDGAVFEMSLNTPFFFELNGELVVMANMHNGGKRYRFGFIGL
jgi:hypothetical protein